MEERCRQCRLRGLPAFKESGAEEIDFIQTIKTGEIHLQAGEAVLEKGRAAERIFTLLSGWAFRFEALPDGRRQILNFLLPGDLIGLQARMLRDATHGVEALTEATLCNFPRDKGWELFHRFPDLAFDLTWLAAREERMVDGALLSAGRRNAAEGVAWLILHLWSRAAPLGLIEGAALTLPVTQAHMADALGLSLVHTNRTIKTLRKRGLFELAGGRLRGVDEVGLRRMAKAAERAERTRPLF